MIENKATNFLVLLDKTCKKESKKIRGRWKYEMKKKT